MIETKSRVIPRNHCSTSKNNLGKQINQTNTTLAKQTSSPIYLLCKLLKNHLDKSSQKSINKFLKDSKVKELPLRLPSPLFADKMVSPSRILRYQEEKKEEMNNCLLYTSPSPRDS